MSILTRATELKIESVLLVVLCFLVGLVRGNARERIATPKTIAIAHFTTNIGDMIMITPLIHAVKVAHPESRVIVIGGNKNREVLAGNPDIDAYISCAHFWTALFQLTEFKPDLGIAVNPSPHELALLYLSGARGISVFSHPSFTSRSFSLLSHLAMPVLYEEGKYVPRQYMKLLEPLGITSSDTTKHLYSNVDAIEKVKTDLYKAHIPESFAVFAPGAGQLFREWAPERFAEVAKYAHDTHNLGIVIAGGPGDKALAKKFTDALPGITVFDGTSQTIEELKALVSLSRIVISNDSGIAYIAEAFNVPAVIVVGISDANEHPKGSPLARVVMPARQEFVARSYVSNLDTVNVEGARKHLDSIPVTKVTAELDSILKP